MLAPEQAVSELALPTLDLRVLARRVVPPVALALAAVAALIMLGGRVHAVTDALRRTLGVSTGWAAAAIVFESLSMIGYVLLLSLVAGRATPRIGARESAQITFAGAAATRLLPTAGAGGAALTLWTLRRSGLSARGAARTILVFMVLLYSVFLASILVAGTLLALRLISSHGPTALSVVPAVAAGAGIAVSLALAARPRENGADWEEQVGGRLLRIRLTTAAELLGDAVRDACRVLRSGDFRLAGAIAYWGFDAAVLWATLHAFGAAPVLPVVALAYFVGQVANTVPLPGSVSGGIAGVLIAFGVPAELALPAVLAYRTIAVWLPSPAALAALPAFRATIARWAIEDSRRS